MSKLKGSLVVSGDALAAGKSIARSIDGIAFDTNGNVIIDSYTKDEFNTIVSVIPLSHFGDFTNTALPITGSGYVVNFSSTIPVLLSGKSFTMPIQTVNLTTIKTNPASTTFNLYIKMSQGIAQYFITEAVIAESGTSAYNTFWVGTIITNTTQIASVNLIKRSRLDVFGASATAAGSSFPVSTGFPSGTGTISW